MRGLHCLAFLAGVAGVWAGALPTFAADNFIWNNGNGNVWNAAANWNPNGVPQAAGDTATITNAPTGTSITLNDLDPTLDAFDINSKNTFFQIVGRTMTVNATGTKANLTNARVLLNGSTWAGTATLTNAIPLADGVFTIQGASTISAPFVQTGAMQVSGTRVGNTPVDANLAIGNFDNKGRLRLNSNVGIGDASITVAGGNGTLTNSNLMEIEVGTGGARSMEGTLVNGNGATLTIDTSFTVLGNGTAAHVNNALIQITRKTAVFKPIGASFTNVAGATIKGIGKLDRTGVPGGSFINRGVIDPGLSPGTLTIDGDYEEGTSALLNIEIGGNVVDFTYDQLVINGHALLAGQLNPTLIDGFVPSSLDVFVVLDATVGITGRYLNAPLDGSVIDVNGGSFEVHYLQGTGPQQFVVLSNFVAVPEPATLCILALPLATLLCRRRPGSRS